ncbi:hypothetical protein KAM477_34280 [Aeromonas caviae]|nr:hypothetical protein KAM473_22740 [Aeromonas caviae]GKR62806.1 hypothetical protein KAM477_34280 [Aeromonas caviae]
MGKPFRDPELTLVVARKMYTHPLAKCRRAFANIDGDVKYFASDTANQLALRMRGKLIMQSTQHALAGFGVIVLNKGNGAANGLFKLFLVEAFKEEPALIAKNLGLDDFYVGDTSIDDVHFDLGNLDSGAGNGE